SASVARMKAFKGNSGCSRKANLGFRSAALLRRSSFIVSPWSLECKTRLACRSVQSFRRAVSTETEPIVKNSSHGRNTRLLLTRPKSSGKWLELQRGMRLVACHVGGFYVCHEDVQCKAGCEPAHPSEICRRGGCRPRGAAARPQRQSD